MNELSINLPINNETFHRSAGRSPVLALIGLLVISAVTVCAQSGRRAPKSKSIPAATPEASPTPAPQKSPEKPALLVFLGIDAHDSFSSIPLYFYDSVLKSCAERLRNSSSVKVEVNSRDMSRGDAVTRAKSEQEGYVALLQLRVEGMGSNSRNADLSRVYIEYFVLAPITAKQVAAGHAYQQASPYKDINVGKSSSNIAYVEYRLKQASRDVAVRILASLAGRKSPADQPR